MSTRLGKYGRWSPDGGLFNDGWLYMMDTVQLTEANHGWS